jgi:DNA-binding protein H-NS
MIADIIHPTQEWEAALAKRVPLRKKRGAKAAKRPVKAAKRPAKIAKRSKAEAAPPRRRKAQPAGQAARNLAAMSVDALLALRDRIGTVLNEKTAEIRKQIQRLDIGDRRSSGRKGAGGRPRKGGKIAPKYRDPDDPSNVWAGRGAVPRWMAAKIKAGAKREDFLIGSSEAPLRKKRGAKAAKRPVKAAKRPAKIAKRSKAKAAPPRRRKVQPAGQAAANNAANTAATE